MKKIYLLSLLSSAALVACGGQSNPPSTTEMGTISLSFYKVDAQGRIQAQDIYSDKTTNIRVRVSNAAIGFNAVQDVDLTAGGTGNVQVNAPAVNGYKVEAVSYTKSSSEFLKYGQVGSVNVQANNVTNVDLPLQRPNIAITLPASVSSGEQFEFNVSGAPEYFGDFFYIKTTSSLLTANPWNFESSSIFGRNGSFKANAPAASSEGNMYTYFIFSMYLDNSWKATGGADSYLYFHSLNIDFGEKPISSVLKVPGGGIGIKIGY